MMEMSNAEAAGTYRDMTLARGLAHASDEDKALLAELLKRVEGTRQEHEVFRQWCDRADRLYFAETITENHGADLWPEHESATINGRQHVSVNTPAAYVDIPAALQAVEPIENVLATDTTPESRAAAAATERVYTAWKQAEDFDLKWHKAILTKGLYGRTAARLYWDKDAEDGEGRVCVEVIQQPRHLFFGWKTDAFEQLEWAAYRTFYEPNALTEQFGVEVLPLREQDTGYTIPMVQQKSWDDLPARAWSAMGVSRVEVWDYWYRKALWRRGKFVKMETWNVVIAGNYVLRGPLKYPEYKGQLPYVPLFNSFVPGMPGGRPDLYDIEPLIREKMERMTSGSQMIANVTGGDSYQLVGPEAPPTVPKGLKPVKGGLVAPGPGNRIEVITPFIAQFQLEQHLGRIDREAAVITGLNELLLGLAPAQVLSSSKAINALIAQFEARLSLRRKLLYKFRRDVWKLALQIMEQKLKGEKGDGLRAMVAAGAGYLEILDPSLNPRDDMETMQRALNAVNNKIASQRTAMNWIGIEDPETEQDLIREERTDATMFPADVQVMAQLLGALQALGLQANGQTQGMAQGQVNSGQADLRAALGAGGQGSPGSQYGEQPVTPAIPGAPPEAQPGNASGPLVSPPDNQPVLQGMVMNGEAKGRIMTQQKLGRR